MSEQETFIKIAELERELQILKKKSLNTQVGQIMSQKTIKNILVQNQSNPQENTSTSKKINKMKSTVKKSIEDDEKEEWTSSDPEQVI